MKILPGIMLWLIHGIAVAQSTEFKTIKISPDLELIKITGNAFVHVSYMNSPDYGRIGANGLIFMDKNEAFLFDTPWNDALTSELLNFVTDSLKLEIVGFVPTHWHDDCIGGLGSIQKQNIKSWANELTIDIARSKHFPVPEHGFKDSLAIKLGDKLISCYYLGAAHATDNIVVWIPSEKILFPGCIVKSLDSKNLGNTTDGDLKSYPSTLEKIIRKFRDSEVVIPGHGQFGDTELLQHTLDLAKKNN